MYAADYRQIARDRLKGKWVMAIIVGFIASIMGGSIAMDYTGASVNIDEELESIHLGGAAGVFVAGIIGIVLLITGILGLIQFIIGGAAQMGYAAFNLDIVDQVPTSASVLFSQFNRLKDGFVMRLLTRIFIALWSLLFVIPGIMKTYSYAMAPYILVENPHMTGLEAITASKEMMYGHRWELFCLKLSFIGWDLLSLFTVGVLQLWICPYREAAVAAFYRNLKAQKSEYYVN